MCRSHGRARYGYEPVTLTAQVQVAGASTTSVCAPRVVAEVTDCPDAPVSLTAAVPLGDDPTGVTNTWKDGPEAGAGTHLNAQPMFQPAAVVVKVGLVQFPCIWVGPRSTCAGPAGALDEVVPDVVVVVDPPACVVVVDPPAAVVVVAEPLEPPDPDDVVVVVDPVEVGMRYAGVEADEFAVLCPLPTQ